MAYIVDPINNTLIDDTKPFENSLNKLQNKPTRKPGALPPGTNTIKYSEGGKVKDMNKVVAETKKNAEFDKKYPPLVKTKALIDEGLLDQKVWRSYCTCYTNKFAEIYNDEQLIVFLNQNEGKDLSKNPLVKRFARECIDQIS